MDLVSWLSSSSVKSLTILNSQEWAAIRHDNYSFQELLVNVPCSNSVAALSQTILEGCDMDFDFRDNRQAQRSAVCLNAKCAFKQT